MDWQLIQGGVEILLVATCYGNRDQLRPDGPTGSYTGFILLPTLPLSSFSQSVGCLISCCQTFLTRNLIFFLYISLFFQFQKLVSCRLPGPSYSKGGNLVVWLSDPCASCNQSRFTRYQHACKTSAHAQGLFSNWPLRMRTLHNKNACF